MSHRTFYGTCTFHPVCVSAIGFLYMPGRRCVGNLLQSTCSASATVVHLERCSILVPPGMIESLRRSPPFYGSRLWSFSYSASTELAAPPDPLLLAGLEGAKQQIQGHH